MAASIAKTGPVGSRHINVDRQLQQLLEHQACERKA